MDKNEVQKCLTDFLGCQGFFPHTNAVYHSHVDRLIKHQVHGLIDIKQELVQN